MTLLLIFVMIPFVYMTLKRYRKAEERRLQMDRLYVASLTKIRDDFEFKIYNMTQEFTAGKEQWNDINHILASINRDNKYKSDYGLTKLLVPVENHRFLNSIGINRDDINVDNKLIFLLMPFHSSFRNHYLAIRDACNDIGLHCFRGDERKVDNITREFVMGILRARLVVALLDGRNANVFYELGLSYAFDKTIILASESPADLSVDLAGNKVIFYKTLEDLYDLIKNEISRALVG